MKSGCINIAPFDGTGIIDSRVFGRPLDRLLKRVHEIPVDLRFEDVARGSQIPSGSSEIYTLVNREKNDAGRATGDSQLLRDLKATHVAEIDVQQNNIWMQVCGFGECCRSGRELPDDHEIGLEQIHHDVEQLRAVIYTQKSFHF